MKDYGENMNENQEFILTRYMDGHSFRPILGVGVRMKNHPQQLYIPDIARIDLELFDDILKFLNSIDMTSIK